VRVVASEARGLGSSPPPPPTPTKRSTDWEDSLVDSKASAVPPPLALGQVYGEPDGVSVSGRGWRCRGDCLGGHEASATPPPRSTPTAPRTVAFSS
jgi:hypothetical protein